MSETKYHYPNKKFIELCNKGLDQQVLKEKLDCSLCGYGSDADEYMLLMCYDIELQRFCVPKFTPYNNEGEHIEFDICEICSILSLSDESLFLEDDRFEFVEFPKKKNK